MSRALTREGGGGVRRGVKGAKREAGCEAGPAKSWLAGWRALECAGPIGVVPGWARSSWAALCPLGGGRSL